MIFQLRAIPLDLLFQFWGFGLIFTFLYFVIRLLPKMNQDRKELREKTLKIDKESGLPIQRSEKAKKLLNFKLKSWILALCFNWVLIIVFTVLFFIIICIESQNALILHQNILIILECSYIIINLSGTIIFIKIIIFYVRISTFSK